MFWGALSFLSADYLGLQSGGKVVALLLFSQMKLFLIPEVSFQKQLLPFTPPPPPKKSKKLGSDKFV